LADVEPACDRGAPGDVDRFLRYTGQLDAGAQHERARSCSLCGRIAHRRCGAWATACVPVFAETSAGTNWRITGDWVGGAAERNSALSEGAFQQYRQAKYVYDGK